MVRPRERRSRLDTTITSEKMKLRNRSLGTALVTIRQICPCNGSKLRRGTTKRGREKTT